MKIALNKKYPLAVKDQIKWQIRNMIESGDLSLGQMLPSAKDMAALLNINRNTVSVAYKELAGEGFLESVKGSGTFVKKGGVAGRTKVLSRVFEKAFQEAASLGCSREEIFEFLLAYAATHVSNSQGRTVLVVECNQEGLDHLCASLELELAVAAKGVLIQDIEQNPSHFATLLASADLVVCGFNHMEELRKALPEIPVDVIGVMWKPEARILNELFQLPPGTRVGFTCANQRSTETFYKTQIFSGGSGLIRIWAGMDDKHKVGKMLDQCDVVFATHYVFDRVRELASPDKRLIDVELCIDASSIRYIKERLDHKCC